MPPIRPASLPSAVLAATCVLFLRATWAQDISGAYQVTTDQTSVQIPEWGVGCGPRVEAHNGTTGRSATVSTSNGQVVIQDGSRRYRTDQCWSDNRSLQRLSTSHTGSQWNVACATPQSDYQQERGSYA